MVRLAVATNEHTNNGQLHEHAGASAARTFSDQNCASMVPCLEVLLKGKGKERATNMRAMSVIFPSPSIVTNNHSITIRVTATPTKNQGAAPLPVLQQASWSCSRRL